MLLWQLAEIHLYLCIYFYFSEIKPIVNDKVTVLVIWITLAQSCFMYVYISVTDSALQAVGAEWKTDVWTALSTSAVTSRSNPTALSPAICSPAPAGRLKPGVR